jgi:protein-S-isoprenylcysteine O-methyltransferase Ste14
VPPPVERSTYVLVSSLLLGLLFWQWRPIPAVVWDVGHPAGRWLLHAVFWAGWALVLVSTFLIDHFDLFGLRQVYLYASGREYTPPAFRTPGLYRYVRHPLMTGFLLAFWATPTMTAGHLLFAVATTGYILIALKLEEQDLAGYHGDQYRAYRKQVGMLFPLPRGSKRSSSD